ncbi:hypothetical protein ATANTOWER_032324 [Ataeniobius toweri]|uniref:Ig-like domain-containing protein n=1 Tax=Ataeniobius toweri TaxID=208326 RepID=A0ABU7CFH7_9TELE|nr:hypothetical protein [Ataeniobius toweri]
MVNFLRYCCTSCVICCTFWIFWQAEAKTISQAVGSTVILNCSNNSVKNFIMATWTMNGNNLFSFSRRGNKSASNKSVHLNLKTSESQSQMFALIIEDAQKSHEGNYTCEMTADSGVSAEQWELIITEANNSIEALKIPVIAAVPSVCFLLLVSVLVILTVRKKRARNRSPTAIRQQKQVEDIYENHLEIQRRQGCHHHP